METIKTQDVWKLVGHSYQIADTGDYDGYYEITNGSISIFTKNDEEETLQPIVQALNDSGAKFYVDDALQLENEILTQAYKDLEEQYEANLQEARIEAKKTFVAEFKQFMDAAKTNT